MTSRISKSLPQPNSYPLVIFDMDGTLVDSFGLFIELMNNFANKYGYEQLHTDRIETLRALPPKQIRQALGLSFFSSLRLMYDCKKAMQKRHTTPALFDHVLDLLAELKAQGAMLAIVTSNNKVNCRRYLGEGYEYFDWLECNASIYGKARQMKKIIRRSGCQLNQVIYVGDQIIDVQSAHQNNIHSAAVTWGYNNEQALTSQQPHFLVHTMDELREILITQ